MSRDYHTFFPAVPSTRLALFEDLAPLLAARGMSFSGECMELAWDAGAAEYTFTYREMTCDTAREAILKTQDWAGVLLEYDAPFGDRTICFWHAEHGRGEAFGFEDTAGHFGTLAEDDARWRAFEDFVLDLVSALGTDSAIVLPSHSRVTLETSDIVRLVGEMSADPVRARPPLIVLRHSIELAASARSVLGQCYLMRDAGDHAVYQEHYFGMGPP